MAHLGFEINASDLPEVQDDFAPIPQGDYTATIKACELMQTKAGTGSYLKLQWSVTGPTHSNRVVFQNITLQNPNKTAEEIGQKNIAQLMSALKIPKLSDTDQLIGGNATIKVTIRKSEEWGDSNEVKAVKPMAGTPAPAQLETPASSSPPWARK